MFWFITYKTLGLLKFQCHFWIPWTIYYKMHCHFVKGVDIFEVEHKTWALYPLMAYILQILYLNGVIHSNRPLNGIRPKKKIVWLPSTDRPYSPTQTIFYWKIFFFSKICKTYRKIQKKNHVIIFAFFDIPVTESMVWYSRYEYRIRIHRDPKSALPSGYYCYSVNIAISYAVNNS